MNLLPLILPFCLLRCFTSHGLEPATEIDLTTTAPEEKVSVAEEILVVDASPPDTPKFNPAGPKSPTPTPRKDPPLKPGQHQVLAESTWTNSTGDGKDESWRYLLYLPKGYEQESAEPWPLLFYLHGRSLRGRDLQKLKRYGPPSFLDRRSDFPFVTVSPQLPDGSWPSGSLVKLVDEVTKKYNVDPNRVYLAGVSLGGGGAWYLAAADPDRFAALVPVCGYAGTSISSRLSNLPIWAFHGAKDEIVPLEPHQKLVDAVNAAGGNAKLTIYPEGTHGNIIVPTFKNQEMYQWLLKQRRKP